MNLKPSKRIPGLIVISVIVLACVIRFLNPDFFNHLEGITYDMRAREALKFRPTIATNLGFVFINENAVRDVWNRSFGYSYGLLWPRHIYGRVVQELFEQGAKAVAFDVILRELRPDHNPVRMADGRVIDSDEFFAFQMRRANNVFIAATKEGLPPALFLTNALAVGDISMDKDPDGRLRRAQICSIYRKWHVAFLKAQDDPDIHLELSQAQFEPGRIVFPRQDEQGKKDITIPLDKDGNFDLADVSNLTGKAKPFTEERLWHMGVLLAAQELKLDLARAEVDLPHGRITLRGEGGLTRVIPVDANGYCYIDWCIPPNHPLLTQEPFESLLAQNFARLNHQTNGLSNRWQGKLAIVGSSAVMGNNLTDRGATPLDKDTLLVSKHWNVANSIITGRFVRVSPLELDFGFIALLCILAGVLTWESGPLVAVGMVLFTLVTYVALGAVLYVQKRYWIPLVLPVLGASLAHIGVVAWRVVFEQAERRRVRSIFSKIVSPKIVNELLEAESLSLGGARRQITVMFADVRGFTELTDTAQERAADWVRQHKLTGAAAEAHFDEQARETLAIVNLYLGLVADIVIKQDGTLDKFIGDCVMAFWGAPTANPKHATSCVRAAIEAQRAIYNLNRQREMENKKRELENRARSSAGLDPRPLLPLLLLGSGINTGMATVGLMGSQAEQQNYTVFGGEVNLASRLEGASGRGRIFIGETTYAHLLRDDHALAATCVAQEPLKLKGIATPVKAYEVPWRQPATTQPEQALVKDVAAGSPAA